MWGATVWFQPICSGPPGRDRWEGWLLGWLLIAVLGIIWAVFLFPFLRHGGSPTSSVEEFERKMDLLAETNKAPRGRWVLTPRKGERFLGKRDRTRSRLRRRRRQVLALLSEAILLTLLIGLFPPFHVMLIGAGVLALLLLAYAAMLVRLRVGEVERGRALRAALARREQAAGTGSRGAVAANGHAPARAAWAASVAAASLRESGIRVLDEGEDGSGELRIIVDDDVHLILHRSDELDLSELRAASR